MTDVQPQILFLAWQDAASRSIIPVGRLMRLPGGYEFAYIGHVGKARLRGFQPLVTFPSFDEVYRSGQLPPLFSNRLMSSTRGDFVQHIQRLGLQPDEAEPFTVLARSAGKRQTDKLEVFAPPTVTRTTAEGLCLARGVRHIPGAEDAAEQLKFGAPLSVLPDERNQTNPAALQLNDERGQPLGYVPDYLAQELAEHGCPASALAVSVSRVNPRPAPVHHRLLCSFVCEHEAVPRFFTGPGFQPLSDSATPASAA